MSVTVSYTPTNNEDTIIPVAVFVVGTTWEMHYRSPHKPRVTFAGSRFWEISEERKSPGKLRLVCKFFRLGINNAYTYTLLSWVSWLMTDSFDYNKRFGLNNADSWRNQQPKKARQL